MDITSSAASGLIVSAATALGALFTGASVIIAVIQYRLQSRRTALGAVRAALLEIRQNVERADILLSEALFSQVSREVTAAIRELFFQAYPKESATPDQLVSFLLDSAYQNFVGDCIYAGVEKASGVAEFRKLGDLLERKVLDLRERLPIAALVLSRLVFYVTRSGDAPISPYMLANTIRDRDLVNDVLLKRLKQISNASLMFPEVAVFLESMSKTMMQQTGQDVIDDARRIVEVVITDLLKLPFSDLERESRLQLRNYPKALRIDLPTSIQDAFECLKLMKHNFSDEDWTKIVEAKTRLYEKTKLTPKSEAPARGA